MDVQEGTVVLRNARRVPRMWDAGVTLRQGIEASLRRATPSLKHIQDITDHAIGTNPYFSAGR